MNNKNTKLIQDIFDITVVIQNHCPELYKNLAETPLIISYDKSKIKDADYQQYLEFLKIQLKESSKNIKTKRCE